ncbi:MAG TPA: hypothetical protein VFA33_04085 [Bryobacteraceae bacterium]|nr:hypothetical protein [Bryobacteraceae bacterium]
MKKALLAWGLASALSCGAMAQIALLHIQVIEGEGAVHLPGSRGARPLSVLVTDENGRPQAGVAVTFHLPEEGPSGMFANGLRTDLVLTDAYGRATLRSLQVNRIQGPFRIRITAVKDQVRAGVVSLQSIGEGRNAVESAPSATAKTSASVPARAKSGKRKWVLVAVAAAAAAAVGFYAGPAAGKGSTTAPAAVTAPAVSVGQPTISLGRP